MVRLLVAATAAVAAAAGSAEGRQYANPGKCGPLAYSTSSSAGWAWEQTQLWDDVQAACPAGFGKTRIAGVSVWAGDFLHGIEATYDTDGVSHLAGAHAAPDVSKSTWRHHFDLPAGEVITGVRGRQGAFLDMISIDTSEKVCAGAAGGGTECKPKSYHYGTGKGGDFDVALEPGQAVLAFFGGLGANHMHHIGAHAAVPDERGWFGAFQPQAVPEGVAFMLRAARPSAGAAPLYLHADTTAINPPAQLSSACKTAPFMTGSAGCKWTFVKAPKEDGELGFYYLRANTKVELFLHAARAAGAAAGGAVELSSYCARTYDRRCLWRLEPSATRPHHFYLQNAVRQPSLYMSTALDAASADRGMRAGAQQTLGACNHAENLSGCQWEVEGLPEDCVVGAWGAWGACDKTCGVGAQTRTRKALQQAYLGGRACGAQAGTPLTDARPCATAPCPVNCATGPWQSFGACSKTCGESWRQRERVVTTAPRSGGRPCPALTQRARCATPACARKCEASAPVCDKLCSKTCGAGTLTCRRTIVHKGDGLDCPALVFTKPCDYGHCKKNCDFAEEYSAWGACSVSCGEGRQERSKQVLKTYPGVVCTPPSEQRACMASPCPGDCVTTPWSCSQCHGKCGVGIQKLCVRNQVLKATNGKKCPLMERQFCDLPMCAQNCKMSEWENWSACTATCGAGTQKRHRIVRQAARFGGACDFKMHESRACTGLALCPIDCKMRWDTCTKCTKTCGGGTKFCRGKILGPAAQGGKACPAANGFDNKDMTLSLVAADLKCAEKECPGDCKLTPWGSWSACSRSCGAKGVQYRKRFKIVAETGAGTCGALFSEQPCSVPCPVDCQVSSWSKASACSTSCGGGRMSRTRTVVQAAAHGGTPCVPLVEAWACNTDPCPIDCQHSPYVEWGPCSHTCGAGHRHRSRTVIAQPQHGGLPCGKGHDWQECSNQPCPGDCEVTKWVCDTCDKTCAGGKQNCRREITKAPVAGGKPCGIVTESRLCNQFACPVDCQIGLWGGWGVCSASCGTGVRTRLRAPLVKAAHNGTPCPALSDKRACSTAPCSQDCAYGPWNAWGPCSAKCGGGSQVATRSIIGQPASGGELCYESKMRNTRACNTTPCPIACTVSSWEPWSACEKSCGNGTQKRTRFITRHAAYAGTVCPSLVDERACSSSGVGTVPCPVDCRVTPWVGCSKCSRYCGGGSKQCSRSVIAPAAHGGLDCPVTAGEVPCNAFACPEDCQTSDWSSWSTCTRSCGEGTQTRSRSLLVEAQFGGTCGASTQTQKCTHAVCPTPPPQDCVVHVKVPWTACPRSCGGAWQTQTNVILQQASNGGHPCPPADQRRQCNTAYCPSDCVLGDWTGWGACSSKCGGGTQHRHRFVETPVRFGGKPCGHWQESRSCNTQQCPQDCVVGLFGNCEQCTRTCGMGTQTCTRSISVEPAFGGQKCPATVSYLACGWKLCAVDCVVSKWTDYSACPVTCSGSVRTRARTIVQPPLHGGVSCPALRQHVMCGELACPIDCSVSSWGAWSAGASKCSASCGSGWQARSRHVVFVPAHGGVECPPIAGRRACNTAPCPVDCVVGDWSEWSQCTKVCGNGVTSRSRSIHVAAAHGGKACPAADTLSASMECNSHHCAKTHCHTDHVRCHVSGSSGKRVVVGHRNRFNHVSGQFHCAVKPFDGAKPCQQVRISGVGAGPWVHAAWYKSMAARGEGLNGVYTRDSKVSYGRPVYRSSSEKHPVYLFYYEDHRRKQWIIGTNPGRDAGWMVADSDARTPQAVPASSWLVSDGERWYDDHLVDVDCADACGHLAVSGQTAGLAQSELMGNYYLYDKSVHERPIYQHASKKVFLYYHSDGHRKQWIVSGTIGAATGFLVSESTAFLPQRITEAWLAVDGDHWVKASLGMKLACTKGCACTCDSHPGCCFVKGRVLDNVRIAGSVYQGVEDHDHCCSLCTGHPLCGAWQYSSAGTCILKQGAPVYRVANSALAEDTWAGPKAGDQCKKGESEPGHLGKTWSNSILGKDAVGKDAAGLSASEMANRR